MDFWDQTPASTHRRRKTPRRLPILLLGMGVTIVAISAAILSLRQTTAPSAAPVITILQRVATATPFDVMQANAARLTATYGGGNVIAFTRVPIILTPTAAIEPASADANQLLAQLNRIRSSAGEPLFIEHAALSRWAQSTLRGESSTLLDYGYYASSSLTITLSSSNVADLQPYWTGEYYSEVTTNAYRDIGIAVTSGSPTQFLIVLASQYPLNSPGTQIDIPAEPTQGNQEREIVRLLNQARVAAGLNQLEIDSRLTAAAAIQAQDMASHQFLEHRGTNGTMPVDRARSSGFPSSFVGENILVQPYVHASIAFDGWWNSPPHHDNMMREEYTVIGISWQTAANSSVYYAMVLGSVD